jgi:AcrR family transcriptional regulator
MKGDVHMREKIIKASIRLFNSSGAHSITTNHIIAELGISPGTFYYHFRNKEEIIRAVFEMIVTEFDALYPKDFARFSPEQFAGTVKDTFEIYSRYRFFYTDISMLLDRDEVLAGAYRRNFDERKKTIEAMTDYMSENGFLARTLNESERDSLANNIWMITDYWFTFSRVRGDRPGRSNIEAGVRNYFNFLKTYLAPEVQEKIEVLI